MLNESAPVGAAHGLPLLAKFRAQYERADAAPEPAPPPRASTKQAAATPEPKAPAPAASAPTGSAPGMMQASPVRSGQQVYAENSDLTVLTTVGAGAEAIADGSIHIYGALRGRALAGALGGLNGLVFTAGVGENAAPVRAAVCRACAWLGLELDEAANAAHGPRISAPGSRPSSVRTWKPLQMPSTKPPRAAWSRIAGAMGEWAAMAPQRR